MRNARIPVFLLFALGVLMIALAPGTVNATRDREKVKIQDDCDPTDPNWAPTGGCLLEEGTVTEAEFRVFSFMTTGSPLAASVIGHPAWRNDPGYLVLPFGEDLKVLNTGGRNHTFTEVANFGGGNVPPLSTGLALAPECPGAQVLPAGGRVDVSGLNAGLHKSSAASIPGCARS
jgi:hypothetical protein